MAMFEHFKERPPVHVLLAGFVGFKSKGAQPQLSREDFLGYVMSTGVARMDESALKLVKSANG